MATFTNQATLRYNNVTRASNITTGQLLEALSITKTAVTGTYTPDDTISYIISVVNTSNTTLTNLTLTDNLGAYTSGTATLYPLTYVEGSLTYYVNGVLQTAPSVTAGPPLTISGIAIPAGGNVTIVYETTANEFAPVAAGSTITNTATIQGTGVSTPVTASETVTVRETSDLTISKSLSPTVVSENGLLTYTFVVQNTGNREAGAQDNVTISDTFLPRLANISVTYNGTPWTEGVQYNYNETTGEFTTVPGLITVPAATYTQDPDTGEIISTPGFATLTVTGNVL